MRNDHRCRLRLVVPSRARVLGTLAALSLTLPGAAVAQRLVEKPEQVVSVSKGASVLVINQTALQRFSMGDPAVAEAVVVSPTEVLVNGKSLGTTTLVLWDNAGTPRLYSVVVTADAVGMERYLHTLLPDERIQVTATGNSVTLSGTVHDRSVADRAVQIAQGSGANVIDNLSTPDAVQVKLKVRFAEVNRTALKSFSSQIATKNIQQLDRQGRLDQLDQHQSAVGCLLGWRARLRPVRAQSRRAEFQPRGPAPGADE